MQYTDNEAALIGGLISTYFFQPAVSASLKDVYSRVLEHLQQNALTFSDLQQIRKAVNFLMPSVPNMTPFTMVQPPDCGILIRVLPVFP